MPSDAMRDRLAKLRAIHAPMVDVIEALLAEREAVGATAEWENGHGESLRPVIEATDAALERLAGSGERGGCVMQQADPATRLIAWVNAGMNREARIGNGECVLYVRARAVARGSRDRTVDAIHDALAAAWRDAREAESA